jgi:hypothetical protein
MAPPSHMQSFIDWNIMQRMTVMKITIAKIYMETMKPTILYTLQCSMQLPQPSKPSVH